MTVTSVSAPTASDGASHAFDFTPIDVLIVSTGVSRSLFPFLAQYRQEQWNQQQRQQIDQKRQPRGQSGKRPRQRDEQKATEVDCRRLPSHEGAAAGAGEQIADKGHLGCHGHGNTDPEQQTADENGLQVWQVDTGAAGKRKQKDTGQQKRAAAEAVCGQSGKGRDQNDGQRRCGHEKSGQIIGGRVIRKAGRQRRKRRADRGIGHDFESCRHQQRNSRRFQPERPV